MRAVESGHAALLGNAQSPVKRFHAFQLDIYEPPRLHDHAVLISDLNKEGTRRDQRSEIGVVEAVEHVEIELVEGSLIEEKGCALGQVSGLEVPVIEMTARDDHSEALLGRSRPQRRVAAVGK